MEAEIEKVRREKNRLAEELKQLKELTQVMEEADQVAEHVDREKQRLAQLQQEELKRKEDSKHIWGVGNPLHFPASAYTQDVFTINHPLLLTGKVIPSCALVRPNSKKLKMKKKVLLHALRLACMRKVLEAESLYQERDGEKAHRPLHLALLEGIKLLSKPSPYAMARAEAFKTSGHVYEEEEPDNDDNEEEPSDDLSEDTEDDYEEDTEEFVIESNSDEALQTEERETAEVGGDSETTLNNIMVRVLRVKQKKKSRKWQYVLVIECKSNKSWTENAIYQALRYAHDRALLNVEQRCLTPVHVMVVTETDWSYGVLDVFGTVELQNGQIVYDGFQEYEKTRWQSRPRYRGREFQPFPRFTRVKLEEMLNRKRQMLRKNCKLYPEVDYPDGKYLVGNVYINKQRRSLPRFGDFALNFLTPGALLFYRTLFRIVLGERVLKWSVDDVIKAYTRRDAFYEEQLDAVFPAPKKLKPTPACDV